MNNFHLTGTPDSLTPAEAVVLGLVDEGLSNHQISATLSVAQSA
jgi:DNA-binding NarL/FixJ family response regulator